MRPTPNTCERGSDVTPHLDTWQTRISIGPGNVRMGANSIGATQLPGRLSSFSCDAKGLTSITSKEPIAYDRSRGLISGKDR